MHGTERADPGAFFEGRFKSVAILYDVAAKPFSFTNFVLPGTMGEPWYLTFGQTDPATLAYNTKPGSETSRGTPASQAQAISRTPGLDSLVIAPMVDQALTEVDLLPPAGRRRVAEHVQRLA